MNGKSENCSSMIAGGTLMTLESSISSYWDLMEFNGIEWDFMEFNGI